MSSKLLLLKKLRTYVLVCGIKFSGYRVVPLSRLSTVLKLYNRFFGYFVVLPVDNCTRYPIEERSKIPILHCNFDVFPEVVVLDVWIHNFNFCRFILSLLNTCLVLHHYLSWLLYYCFFFLLYLRVAHDTRPKQTVDMWKTQNRKNAACL